MPDHNLKIPADRPADAPSGKKPASRRGIKSQWVKQFLLESVRETLNVPLNQVLQRCDALIVEAQASGQQGYVAEMKRIQSAASHLRTLVGGSAVVSPAAPLQPAGTAIISSKAADIATLVQATAKDQPNSSLRESGALLVVDDDPVVREILPMILQEYGHQVTVAQDGAQALEFIHGQDFEVVLLDIAMPVLDGYQVLEYLKSDMTWRHIPIIMLSGSDDPKNIIRCLELGADDYLAKPFNPVLLQARIGACLEKKRLRDLEQSYLNQLQAEQEKSERLLLNILPVLIADRLKQGESTIVDYFPDVTVLFSDLVDFTKMSTTMSPRDLVRLLNEIFSAFDRLAKRHGLEKIKTIGDAYMVVGGLPKPMPDHVEAVAEMALDMQTEVEQFNAAFQANIKIRIGINTGPVVAGIIGKDKFIYDLWGDTVNTASRMESHGQPGCIQVTAETHQRLIDKFLFTERGPIEVKGKGVMTTHFLTGRKTTEGEDTSPETFT